MFSIITMASSTTKPIEMVSAISEKLSSAKPSAHIAASVPAMDSGTVTPAATVGIRRRMNTTTTISTRATVISMVHCTSSTLARMVVVRSDSTVSFTSGGIHACNCGRAASTASVVSMTLAPEDLVSVSRMAGCLPNHAARRVLDTPSMTEATWDRRTTAPLLVFTTSGAYSRALEICPFSPMLSARSGP